MPELGKDQPTKCRLSAGQAREGRGIGVILATRGMPR